MNLLDILVCFNSPIKEEQAWAVCFLCGKALKDQEAEQKLAPCGPKSIIFDKDGRITITGAFCNDEAEIVDSLGRAIFAALDYGLSSDEQQVISSELDHLISLMTGTAILSEDDAADEGFDDNKAQEITIDDVISLCEQHISSNETLSHYLAVCRALVHEALELQVFLSKIASANACLQKLSSTDKSNLEQKSDDVTGLNFKEWAHVWMQVLDELRQGVTKLRKVERHTKMSVEYELTPYEILMEDIRQKKYTLKKVTSKEKISPEIKKNAHDIILDFIRSRPNLSPAHERILKPTPPRSKSLHELLLEQIKGQSISLKHVEMTSSRSFTIKPTSCRSGDVVTHRRRLKPSFVIDDDVVSLKTDSDIEDLEVYVADSDVIGDVSSTNFCREDLTNTSLRSSAETSGVSSSSAGDVTSSVYRPSNLKLSQTMQRKRLLPLELLPSPAQSPISTSPQRRLSFFGSIFSSFRNSTQLRRSQSAFTSMVDLKTERKPIETNKHILSSTREESNLKSIPVNSTPLRRTFSERIGKPSVTNSASVSLTLEEVMHIRQVLTRAKLEKFQASPAIYHALKNEKICFHCRVKKFYIFSWPYTCQICKRKVCGKCLKKVRCPADKYIITPVHSLGPALTPIMLKRKTIVDQSSIPSHCDRLADVSSSQSFRAKKTDVCLECFEMICAGKLTDN